MAIGISIFDEDRDRDRDLNLGDRAHALHVSNNYTVKSLFALLYL